MQWFAPSPDEPAYLAAASRANSSEALYEDLVGLWCELLASSAPEVTVSVNLLDGVIEGPECGHVTRSIACVWLEVVYAAIPIDPEDDMEAYEEAASTMHREFADLVTAAFQDQRVEAAFALNPRPAFTQHHWEDPETRVRIA
jgi:hypothetical protein